MNQRMWAWKLIMLLIALSKSNHTRSRQLFFMLGLLLPLTNFAQIEIIVPETQGINRTLEPVTLGVPFEQGQLFDGQSISITNPSGNMIPAQFEVMANWRDGSIRWLKCDFQATVVANSEAIYQLHIDQFFPQTVDMIVEETANKISVNTGVLQFEVNKNQYNLFENVFLDLNGDRQFSETEQIVANQLEGFVVQQDNNRYNSTNEAPINIFIEEEGPMKVVIKVEGRHYDQAGNYLLKYESRIYAFAGKPYIKVRHSYANGTSVNSLGNSASEALGERFQRYELTLPLDLEDDKTLVTSIDNRLISTPLDAGVTQLIQKDRPTVAIPFISEITNLDAVLFNGEQADGWLALQDDKWGMLVASRYFWEKYPKGYEVDDQGNFTIQPVPSEEFLWAAMGTSDEFTFHFFPADQSNNLGTIASGVGQNPLVPYVNPDQYIQSGVFYDLYLEENNPWDNMNQYINTITDNHLNNRAELDLYGNIHFGDVPRDQWEVADDRSFSTWGNNYYDCMLTNARLFAQSGDQRYFNIMQPMALHFMETQTFQTYDPDNWMNGYSPAYSLHHRAIDHYNQHYGEGIWYYYYLTGDERAKEIGLRAARSIRDYHVWGLNNPNARLAYQNASACLEAWKATGEASYLNIVRTYIKDRMFATQNEFGQIGNYNSEGGIRFAGAQTFMMALFADTAWKYLKEFPEDEELKEQLIRLADFVDQYARVNPGEEAYYNFWYAPDDPQAPRVFLANAGDDFVFWNGKALIAGLYAYAYDLSGEERFKTMGQNLMDHLWGDGYNNAFGFFAWGKASSQAMKNAIHAAAILGKPLSTNVIDFDVVGSQRLQIAPNPVVDFIKVLNEDNSATFFIFDAFGKMVQSGRYDSNGITVNSFPNGLYYLRIGGRQASFIKVNH